MGPGTMGNPIPHTVYDAILDDCLFAAVLRHSLVVARIHVFAPPFSDKARSYRWAALYLLDLIDKEALHYILP